MIVLGGVGNWHNEVNLSTALIDNFVQGAVGKPENTRSCRNTI